MSPLRRAALPALLLALLPVAPAAAAEHGDPVLLALGDSVAAGVGAVPLAPGYPELVRRALSQGYNPAAGKATPNAATDFDVVNFAESGATTRDLGPPVERALGLIVARQADRDPKNDVEVITLTIGGNDVFGPVAAACVLTAGGPCQRTTDAALAQVREGVTTALARLTAAAGKRVEVVVTTYYNPIGSCFLTALNPAAPTIAEVVLEGGTLPGLVVEAGLNDVLRQAAASTGAQVADLFGALGATDYVGGLDCLHPDASGHAVIADEVVATLAR
jgi:lysophospholipase L1-like esterase